MRGETLVPEGQVKELLGVKVAPRAVGQNIAILNALGSRWLHRDDLLAYLRKNYESTNDPILGRLCQELAEVTAAKGG